VEISHEPLYYTFRRFRAHKDTISVAYVTAVRSLIATRNENTCRSSPDTELDTYVSTAKALPPLYHAKIGPEGSGKAIKSGKEGGTRYVHG
jgi:hypothetical protein